MTDNVMKYRKKPVVIEARQYDGRNAVEIADWLGEHGVKVGWSDVGVRIPSLEGDMLASPGDWVIRGVQGEFYPCKPDIFEETYEQATIAEMITDKTESLARALNDRFGAHPWDTLSKDQQEGYLLDADALLDHLNGVRHAW